MPDHTDKAPHRRASDRSGGSPTVIAPGVTFRGDVIAPGSLMLSGTVRGDGEIGGTLSIARDALWEGKVRASSGVIAGSLVGSIEVSGALEVGESAHIKGEITARTVAIARGATIEGEIQVTSGENIVRFEEKRGG
ncbi:MAG: polymer-forming cytoskeletal protein [Pseudomonadota bacterium]